MPLFSKQIIKPGTYLARDLTGKRKEFVVTPERITHWIKNFNKMRAAGLKVPAPWVHDPQSNPSKEPPGNENGGFWEKLWTSPTGALHGTIDVPIASDAEKVGTVVREVSPLVRPNWKDGMGTEWEDSISHIALVQNPVVPGQDNFEAIAEKNLAATDAQATAASLSDFVAALSDEGTESTQSPETRATAPSVAQVLEALSSAGLTLPEDTTFENLAERIVVAGKALSGTQDADEEKDKMSKEQPNPVAMSQELEAKDAQIATLTKQVDGLAALSLQKHLEAYDLRISDLLKAGTIKADFVEKVVKPLRDSITALSINDDGSIQRVELDTVLETAEAMSPPSATSKFLGEGVAASLTEQDNPNLDGGEMSNERVAEVAAEIAASNGAKLLPVG